MEVITPFWFKQRQCKAEPAGENMLKVSGPNLGEAYISISPAGDHWRAALRLSPDGPDVSVTEPELANPRAAWDAAFSSTATTSLPDRGGNMDELWAELGDDLGVPAGPWREALPPIVARYAEPHRHYHNLAHIGAMLRTVRSLWELAPPTLRLAVWFHDIVYDTRANDNEERSVDLAVAMLGPLGVPAPMVEETGRLILLTRRHCAGAEDQAGQVLLDADLAVLGASEADYDRYAHAIRAEYAWVPEESYRAGRGRVLEGFLQRPRIYQTAALFAQAEAPARRNLAREIAALSSLRERG